MNSIHDILRLPLITEKSTYIKDKHQTLTFRVERGNRYRNAHLDCDLARWALYSDLPQEIDYSTIDADGASISGSAKTTIHPPPCRDLREWSPARCACPHPAASRSKPPTEPAAPTRIASARLEPWLPG